MLRLGLIGDNIATSRAPCLHQWAGQQAGIDVRYDLLIPKALGQDFNSVFATCERQGYSGINVTLPYKECAIAKVTIDDPHVRAIGAVNTVLFEARGPIGHNTDFTGFMEAYRSSRGEKKPGVVCLVGTGGVGRALAFALLALGATELRLVDQDIKKAEALARDLSDHAGAAHVCVEPDIDRAARGASGLVNGTPLGMVGYGGTPIRAETMRGADWVFDAVYQPIETRFLKDAAHVGAETISGYELFFFQGVDAWKHFSGRDVDQGRLRAALKESVCPTTPPA